MRNNVSLASLMPDALIDALEKKFDLSPQELYSPKRLNSDAHFFVITFSEGKKKSEHEIYACNDLEEVTELVQEAIEQCGRNGYSLVVFGRNGTLYDIEIPKVRLKETENG